MKHLIDNVDYTDPSLLVAACGHISHVSLGDQVDIFRFSNLPVDEQCQECVSSSFYVSFVEKEEEDAAASLFYEHTGCDPTSPD